MKKTTLITLLLALFLLSACGAKAAPTLAGTAWKLVSYGPVSAQTPAVADAPTSLVFDDKGKMSGNTGCNGFSGDYTFSDGTLTPGALMSTLMACADPVMSQESAVLGLLNGALKVDLSGDTLKIYSADGQSVLTFARQ